MSRRCAHPRRILILILSWLASLASPGDTVPAEPGYRPGRLLIQPRAGSDSAALERFHGEHRARVTRQFPSLDGFQVLELPADRTVAEQIQAYQQSGLVEWAEPDYLLHTCTTPSDPQFLDGSQWHLENQGKSGARKGVDLDAVSGWDVASEAPDVIVALVDSGIRYTHEDLVGNLWRNPGEIAGNGIDDDRNGYVDDVHGINAVANDGDPLDDIGHGTHVAGILGAVGNNGVGGCGVAWRVQLMACKFLTAEGEGSTSDAIECLDYARIHGAKVINCSWGGSANSVALRNAFRRLRDAGILVAVAAGNDGVDIDSQAQYPASYAYPNMVTVVATTATDGLASFSNYGVAGTDLGAPGVVIASTWFTSDRAYATQSGTSMATPMVSGILALLRAQYPAETAAQLIERLSATVEPVTALSGRCSSGGRANLARALRGLPFVRLTMVGVGGWALEVNGSPGSVCQIEGSQDLNYWQAVSEVSLPANGQATYAGAGTGLPSQFLRVRVVP